MSGQFDNETSRQNFEWHRQRALREKRHPNSTSVNRMIFNVNAIEKKHGTKAAIEIVTGKQYS